MKFKILVIILLFAILAAAIFFYFPREEEQLFHGTFIRSGHGNLHQTEKESGFG
jgi:hypothetical protein